MVTASRTRSAVSTKKVSLLGTYLVLTPLGAAPVERNAGAFLLVLPPTSEVTFKITAALAPCFLHKIIP